MKSIEVNFLSIFGYKGDLTHVHLSDVSVGECFKVENKSSKQLKVYMKCLVDNKISYIDLITGKSCFFKGRQKVQVVEANIQTRHSANNGNKVTTIFAI